MNIALLTAAGKGTRMGQDIPKQFLSIFDKPIIVYTMEIFQNHPAIDEIAIVCLEGWENILQAYANQFNITKLKLIVKGGATGQESIKNGLFEIEKNHNKDDIILIHDGNRTLVSNEIISNSISVCKEKGNAITAIPCVEAVFETENKIESEKPISRDKIVRTQTPHVFYLKDITNLYREAEEKNIQNSVAACTLMTELGKKIYFSQGSEKNIKLTTIEDLEIFKALYKTEKCNWIK